MNHKKELLLWAYRSGDKVGMCQRGFRHVADRNRGFSSALVDLNGS